MEENYKADNKVDLDLNNIRVENANNMDTFLNK